MSHPSLIWKDKHMPLRSPQISPSPAERHFYPESPHQLTLFQGDNKPILEYLHREFRGKISLVYLDPPFDSDANYHRIVRLRGEKTPYISRKQQYHDQWKKHEYLQFIYDRLFIIKELLKEDGSIYLHADWHRIHHLRLLMDEVFGEDKLLNEIIWHHDFGGRSPYFLARKHDNLLLYRKGKEWTFNIDTLPDLPYKGKLHQYQKNTPKKGKKPTAVWSDHPATDFVWDIAYENKMSPHNTGYPTQKPAALLSRIIQLSSLPDEWILDPFLGSGTTALVSARLGRNFIGIDANWDSLHTTRCRLLHENRPFNIDLHRGVSSADTPLQLKYTLTGEHLHLSFSCDDIQDELKIPEHKWKNIDWRAWIQSISISEHHTDQLLENPSIDSPLSKRELVRGSYLISPNTSQIIIEATDIFCRTKRFRIDRN